DEDLFLALEVLVERGSRHLGRVGDVADGRLVEPDSPEEGKRFGDDPVAGARASLPDVEARRAVTGTALDHLTHHHTRVSCARFAAAPSVAVNCGVSTLRHDVR